MPTSVQDGPVVDWDAFDVAAYLRENYARKHEADNWLISRLATDWRQVKEGSGRHLRSADVGTGPNIYPLLTAIAHVASAEIFEPSVSGRSYLLEQLSNFDPCWESWIDHLALLGSPVCHDAFKAKVRLGAGSIYELPPRTYDVVTSFFCAESITDSMARFDEACNSLAGALVPTGTLLAAFMLGSDGYKTGGVEYPAVSLDLHEIERSFASRLTIEDLLLVPTTDLVRPGYTGMAYLRARSS